jgi:hypothetical protein
LDFLFFSYSRPTFSLSPKRQNHPEPTSVSNSSIKEYSFESKFSNSLHQPGFQGVVAPTQDIADETYLQGTSSNQKENSKQSPTKVSVYFFKYFLSI